MKTRSNLGTYKGEASTPALLGLLILMIPLSPRPTIGGAAGTVSVMVAASLLAVGLIYIVPVASSHSALGLLFPWNWAYLALLGTAIYLARVVVNAEMAEYSAAISRLLFVALIVAFAFCFSRHGPFQLLLWFSVGVILLAVLAGFIGFTGLTFIEPVRPARTFGFAVPFFKTAGVPRSFGEQGVVVSIALGFLLVYRKSLSRMFVVAAAVSILVLLGVGQSRNMFLSTLVVILAFGVLRIAPTRTAAALLLIASGASSFLVERLLPTVSATQFGTAFVGEGILEQNVGARFELVEAALKLIASDPVRATIGWSHSDWLNLAGPSLDTTIHNHFVALLVFMGIPASMLILWAAFIAPLSRLISQRTQSGRTGTLELDSATLLAVTVGCGVFVSLNFYEGFFSVSLALYVGLLWSLFTVPVHQVQRYNGRPNLGE